MKGNSGERDGGRIGRIKKSEKDRRSTERTEQAGDYRKGKDERDKNRRGGGEERGDKKGRRECDKKLQ